LSVAALDGSNQTFSQSIRALRAAEAAPKRVHDNLFGLHLVGILPTNVLRVRRYPMSKVEKISVALTPEMAQMVKAGVSSGDYASSSELIREALREWRQKREIQAQAREELGKLWDVGMASGEPIDGPSAIRGLRAKLKEVV
jgi:antitoxin ParD1/3/4